MKPLLLLYPLLCLRPAYTHDLRLYTVVGPIEGISPFSFCIPSPPPARFLARRTKKNV